MTQPVILGDIETVLRSLPLQELRTLQLRAQAELQNRVTTGLNVFFQTLQYALSPEDAPTAIECSPMCRDTLGASGVSIYAPLPEKDPELGTRIQLCLSALDDVSERYSFDIRRDGDLHQLTLHFSVIPGATIPGLGAERCTLQTVLEGREYLRKEVEPLRAVEGGGPQNE